MQEYTYRIAVLTCRKNVKDQWDETIFKETVVKTPMGNSTMLLYEEEVTLVKANINQINTVYPGTSLTLCFKVATIHPEPAHASKSKDCDR
ncbi:MAG: hypothetical protein LBG96_03350 [Tannerella sp.]|nr:hypothetical protein [Tannerella sp.]